MSLIKDLTYLPKEIVQNKQSCNSILSHAVVDNGAYLRLATLLLQSKEGSQLWVTKEVSDDLQAADLNPEEIKFEELEWPAGRLEVYFEDPAIPTFLAVYTSDAEQFDAIKRLTGLQTTVLNEENSIAFKFEERYISLQAEDGEGSMLSVTYTPSDIDKFATGVDADELQDSKVRSPVSVGLVDDEREALRQLAVMLFKVLLLASSEGHEIRRTKDRPTKKQGGKPGFKNRPATDRLIVEYLPRHKAERKRAAEAEGKTHKFLGRRGHWRRFHSPKFVNLQGKKKFIYPIPGPDGRVPRKKFVVKKGFSVPT